MDALVTLDTAYESGVPQLYTNEPRQFHVRVPCRPGRFSSAHQCDDPATIVFRVRSMGRERERERGRGEREGRGGGRRRGREGGRGRKRERGKLG